MSGPNKTITASGWIIPADATRAIGRFNTDGPTGYRADIPDAPVRATRAAAVQDWINAHEVTE